MKNKIVVDTNVLIEDPYWVVKNDNVIIPMCVLEELDSLKTKYGVGFSAREALRNIDKNKIEVDIERYNLGDNFEKTVDNEIIACCIKNQYRLVSFDLSVKIKASSFGVEIFQSTGDQATENKEIGLYCGIKKLIIKDNYIDEIYSNDKFINFSGKEFCPNQYIVCESEIDPKRRVFLRHFKDRGCKKINMNQNLWRDLESKNLEQHFCIDSLLDPSLKLVSLVGIAGTGKTLLAAAAGLKQVFGKWGSDKIYDKMIISRPIKSMGENDIGFLPGMLEDKMAPWVQPVMDNLEFLEKSNKENIASWLEKGKIEIEALAYIRGRSISNCFIIIDEAQNLTPHEVKTILTRAGKGSKVILTGDVEQIDNTKIDKFSNGLTYAVEKMKDYDITSHITLTKGERSKLAEISAKVL